MNLKNKTILVTGSSSGIGRATAVMLAQNGVNVLIHYRKNEEGARETLDAVNKYSNGKIFQADLSNKKEVVKMFANIGQNYKCLDCLVNNAGEYIPGEFGDEELWKSQFENVFFSVVHTTNAFLGLQSGVIRKIVNTASIFGIQNMGSPDAPHYSAAKAAICSFTQTLAKKYAPKILVNAVSPGYTWTKAWERISDKEKKYCENQTQIKRFVEPVEIASMIVELLKNDAITGEIIRVDGGLHLCG